MPEPEKRPNEAASAASSPPRQVDRGKVHSGWTYLSNHTHVLVCLTQDPSARLRDVADRVGITERAVQSIVGDLERAGAITRFREGRRNRYEIHGDARLRHPVEDNCTLRELLKALRASHLPPAP